MAQRKPICGDQGETVGASGDDVLKLLLFLFGLPSTIIGIIKGAIWTVEQGALVTILGVSAPVAVWLAAAAAAVTTFAIVAAFYWKRCGQEPDSLDACSAGVVNGVVPSFGSAVDEVFPFTAMHDRVDVVVKCIYWHLVENNAQFIKCADDPERSPILQGLYESDEVCGAGLGATIGAGVGVVGGILAAAAIAAAIGCATIVLCVIALIVAAIVAVAAVLIGAFLGGQAGKALAGDSEPTAEGGEAIRTGDYVTTKGGLITSGDFDGARVYWFVDETFLHGRSTGSPEFSHTDPDVNLGLDACPSVIR